MTQNVSGSLDETVVAPPQTVRGRFCDIERSLQGEALFRLVRPLTLAILAVGLFSRLTPLLDINDRLFWQYMSEDGYLMQTIARNMAIGLGMTTADGTIATNGVQPLATFIFAGLHWLAGGERVASIALVTGVSAAIAAASAFYLYKLGRVLMRDMEFGDTFALVIAAVWFAAPLPIAHSMNGLETGLYILMTVASLTFFLTHFSGDAARVRTRNTFLLGVLLGATFLARNDAVFFLAALLLTHLLTGRYDRPSLTRRLAECIGAGSISIAIALPWLINNYRLFGTIVPISGISQSHNAALGTNLRRVPAVLFEAAVPVVPIPRVLESLPIVVAVTAAFLVVIVATYWLLCGRRRRENGIFTAITLLFGGALVVYYGLFFGAPHFLSRYMAILSPLLWSMTAFVALFALVGIVPRAGWINLALVAGLSGLLIGTSLLSAQVYRHGKQHMHRQVVEWVAGNVSTDQWVGAVQTGTLGYFHDRTLNLDGKVNPAALRELLLHGHVLDYVVGTPVAFVVDWAGVANWAEYPKAGQFNRHFELVVKNDRENLSVFRRRVVQPTQ